ncbi:MAG: hypothetical protein TRG1_138 [Flavobacteriaceae bacterium FS1-H7996/R]|nr:MAG: hypothetical protein TRG1_138 [Flavobacteriaceae bacterium FS1-H7996/R]
MTVVTFATEFAEKPSCFACSKTAMGGVFIQLDSHQKEQLEL